MVIGDIRPNRNTIQRYFVQVQVNIQFNTVNEQKSLICLVLPEFGYMTLQQLTTDLIATDKQSKTLRCSAERIPAIQQ